MMCLAEAAGRADSAGANKKDTHLKVLQYPLPGVARGLLCVHWTPPCTGNSHRRVILPLLAIPDAPPRCFAHRARSASVLAKYYAALSLDG